MSLRLARSSSARGDRPAEHEVVEIGDDGEVTAVRTWADGRIGRFGRRLDDSEHRSLRAAAADAAESPTARAAGPKGKRRPESGTERVSIDDGTAIEVDPYDDAPEPWTGLVNALRDLLESMGSSPVAAVELAVDSSNNPARVSLRHVGTAPIAVRLGRVTVHARLADEGEATVASATTEISGPSSPETGRLGWRWDVPADLSIPVPADDQYLEVTVDLDVDVDGDGRWRRSRVVATSGV